MTTSTVLLACTSLIAALGCSAGSTVSQESEDVATNESSISAGNATLTLTSSSATSYCAKVMLTNGLIDATSRWQVVIDLKTSKVANTSGATFSGNTGVVTATPTNLNSLIAYGATATFSFCAARTAWTVVPVIKAWNTESAAYATCPTNSGLNPTKAALAVAMAKELGRWDPVNDLTVSAGTGWLTVLSSSGLARCSNGCKNVKAILGQQSVSLTSVVDQSVFSPTALVSDLGASFNRQLNVNNNLRLNEPASLPPSHKLTLVGGPTNLGLGSCGPHYIFQVDNPDGTALTSKQATNMANALCFYGYGSCGSNPYIAFAKTTTGCPSGRTCIAIDPTDGDNSTTSTTTCGSAPTYPLNRVYDPANSLLNTQCITTRGRLGTLVSKCGYIPSTCGYLYCVAN